VTVSLLVQVCGNQTGLEKYKARLAESIMQLMHQFA